MPPRSFKVGEKVMAKWPGSAKFYPAKVIELDDEELEVQFDEGTVYTVPHEHVKAEAAFRSKSRSRSPARTKTKPSPKRSPHRLAKNHVGRPRSRSPGRTSQAAKSTPSARPSETSAPEKSEARPSLRVRNRAKVVEKITPKRSSARIADQRPDYMARTEELLPSSGESEAEADAMETERWRIPWRNMTATCVVVVLFCSLAALTLWLNMVCGKDDCVVRLPKLLKRSIGVYFTVETFLVIGGFLLLQVLITLLPVGKVVNGMPLEDGSCLKYRLNGLHSFAASVAAVLAVEAYGISLQQRVRNTVPLINASLVFALVLSVYLSVRSRTSSSGRQGKLNGERNFVVKYFLGRELNPQIGSLDVKMLLDGRVGLNAWAAVIICYTWEIIKERTWSPELLLVAGLQLLYIFHWHLCEEHMLSTFEMKHESVGFMLVFGNLTFVPFALTVPVRYLAFHRPSLHPAFMVASLLLFAVGYVVMRNSNNQKHEFRKDPYHPKFVAMQTIRTEKSRVLLVDGWWKYVRHPNYVGDLLIGASFSLSCGFQHLIPHFYLLYLVMMLVVRVVRVENRCSSQYGIQWTEYCQRVKYRMIPFVF